MRGKVLMALALTLIAAPARADECGELAEKLVHRYSDTIQLSPLRIVLAASTNWDEPPKELPEREQANWAAIRDGSLALLRRFGKCPPMSSPPPPDKAWFHGDWQHFGITIKEATANFKPTSPVLSPVLGPFGVEAPQKLAVGLSQVVSAGQPGWLVTLAGSPFTGSGSKFARHISMSGSGLVIQAPATSASPGGGGARPSSPQLASVDLAFSWASRRTAYDFTYELSEQTYSHTKEFNQYAWNATRRLATDYANAVEPPAAAGAAAQGLQPRFALQQSAVPAKSHYHDAVGNYWTQNYIQPEQDKDYDSHQDLSLRIRVSPFPEYAPELPDMISAGLQYSGEQRFGNPTAIAYGSFTWNVTGTFSACPRDGSVGLGDCKLADTANFLGDGALGLSALLPSLGVGSPTRVRGVGIFRGTPRKNAAGHPDVSAGGSFAVEVPIGIGITLVGTYTARWIRDTGVQSTSALTFAKSLQ